MPGTIGPVEGELGLNDIITVRSIGGDQLEVDCSALFESGIQVRIDL